MAQNALQGHFGYSSIVHFDAERSFGVVPAPVVTFPMGYPLLIALISRLGLSPETAALLISVLSTIACIPILWWVAERCGVSAAIRNVLLGVFVINALVTGYGASALTEPLFMLLVLGGSALLVNARLHQGKVSLWLWLAVGLAFGLAYLVRYAGLFFVLGLAVLCAHSFLSRHRLLARGHAISFAVALIPVLIGIARNLLLVGDWRGGNAKVVHNELLPVLFNTARAINGIFLTGPGHAPYGGTFVARVLCAGLFYLGMAWVTWNYFRYRAASASPDSKFKGTLIDPLLLALVYSACMFYAGLTTVISYSSRMFLPLTPLLILFLGLALNEMMRVLPRSSALRRLPLLLLIGSLVPYAFLNLSALRNPPPLDVSMLASALESREGATKSARAVIQELAGQDGVIVANNGQAVGYVLQTPTISLVGQEFSTVEWNDSTLRSTLQRFHVNAVLIVADAVAEQLIPRILKRPDAGVNNDLPSRLVEDLAHGNPPQWMKLVHRSGGILIYVPELPSDSAAAADHTRPRLRN
jgi:4-amino-4-deoxy-L-arabinose transferase-like glycosyltransferase